MTEIAPGLTAVSQRDLTETTGLLVAGATSILAAMNDTVMGTPYTQGAGAFECCSTHDTFSFVGGYRPVER